MIFGRTTICPLIILALGGSWDFVTTYSWAYNPAENYRVAYTRGQLGDYYGRVICKAICKW